jgi:hypothetical protein
MPQDSVKEKLMTGNGSDPNKTSNKTPDQIRIMSLSAAPYEDQKRFRVEIILSEFQNPPCIELVLTDPLTKQEISRAQVVDSVLDHLNLTMHIRTNTSQTTFDLQARVYYPETGTEAEKIIPVSLQDL